MLLYEINLHWNGYDRQVQIPLFYERLSGTRLNSIQIEDDPRGSSRPAHLTWLIPICLFSTAWFTRVNLSFCGVVVASNWAVTIMSPNQRLLVPLTPSMSPVCLLHFWPDLTRSQITSASNLVIMFIIRWTDRLVAFVTQTPTGHFFAWLLLSPDPYFIFIYIYIYIWNYDIYKPRDSY